MPSKRPKTTAFTLTELMVVVVVIGLVASFAVPNYTKTLNRARERDAVGNLEFIREAVRLYIVREGVVAPPAFANIGAINTTLKINIFEQEGNTYSCTVANIYTCLATNTAGWQIRFRLDTNDGKVDCSIGPCPSL
ncbi:MAG: prepilin-type N-terminal cleavage/methylation domain-containing protein [Candidatus Omnitrophica bacterium]|nr:prepilin-type N-terminal cleavage/methylation domain-containing protein [Candidatus Omnitrophota bacterium]